MPEWVEENRNRVYRYWVYRKAYTPYEEQTSGPEDSYYESIYCKFGCITEAVDLGCGDWLLGFSDGSGFTDYYRLSDIHIGSYVEDDDYGIEYGYESNDDVW